MCQNSTDSQKSLSGAWAKVQGHATAQLQLSNQSPVMCQLGLSVMKTPFATNDNTTLNAATPSTPRLRTWLGAGKNHHAARRRKGWVPLLFSSPPSFAFDQHQMHRFSQSGGGGRGRTRYTDALPMSSRL